ncbi:class I SAM-dependent methyltransferase [Chloroflexota bacterium]
MAIFDQIAEHYDSWYDDEKGSFIDRVETELAFRLLKIEKGMQVLDFGCGTGNFSVKLAKKGCRVTGVDVSEEMLKIARSKAVMQRFDIDFIRITGDELAFEDSYFDAVVTMATFEFIKDSLKVLAELFRVVKPGGQVLVGTIAKDSAWGEYYESESHQNDSVFKYAYFKTLQDLMSWKKDNLIGTGECLFIPPVSDEHEFNIDQENELAGTRKGGFICALWGK